MGSSQTFTPALLAIDVQEDFCPPKGTLAVAGGREVAPIINRLLDYPFVLKVATRDFHPRDHISFETSHESPNNKAFESRVTIENLHVPGQTTEIPVWPVHCVQGTKGSDLIPELEASKFDKVIEKGRDRSTEMFSAFSDVFGHKSSTAVSLDLTKLLKSSNVSHVFVVGIAGDYCVRCTALDARKEGFEVYVVEEGVRSVDPSSSGWGASKEEFKGHGIHVVSMNGPELDAVSKLT